MARGLRKVLRDAKILPSYKKDVKIGPEEYQVTFALAHLNGEHRADRALRPLNFDLATSTDIYNHGDEWLLRMGRLKRLGYRPDRCLIAARRPTDETGHRGVAYREIRDAILGADFIWADEHDTDKVVEFARLPENPVLKLA